MSDEGPRRGRERPKALGAQSQVTAAPFGRLTVSVEQGTITALALEAQRRGVSLSELTRTALVEWIRRELPAAGPTDARMGMPERRWLAGARGAGCRLICNIQR